MTEPSPVKYSRCDVCGAAEFPGWPMTHRRLCPNNPTPHTDERTAP